MSRFTRRHFLRAAGVAGGALLVDQAGLLGRRGALSGRARADADECRRFVFVTMASGCVPERYWPSSGTRFNYSTEPLERHAADLAIMRGVNMPHRGDHRPFMLATGSGDRDGMIAANPSFDQLLVDAWRGRGYDRPALVLIGKSKNGRPQGHTSFDFGGNAITPLTSPRQAFENVFRRPPSTGTEPTPAPGAGAQQRVDRAVLQASLADLDSIERGLSGREREQTAAHREALERLLGAVEDGGGPIGPVAGEASIAEEPRTYLERMMKLSEVVALAFAADERRVASLQMTPLGHDNMSKSNYRGVTYTEGVLEGLGPDDQAQDDVGGNLHQQIAHGWASNGDYAELMARIHRAEHALLAHLVDVLKATPDPRGGSVFDTTVIYVTNEHAGPNHGVNAPRSQFPTTLIAGSQMGLRVGDYVQLEGGNDLHGSILLSVAERLGVPLSRFGDYTDPWRDLLV